jgi:hypothetical protein
MTGLSRIAPTDTTLRALARSGGPGAAYTALALAHLRLRLGPLCAELLAMRAADPAPATCDRPDRVDSDTLAFWRDCIEVNPAYRFTDEDTRALTQIVPSAAGELLGYRLLIKDTRTPRATTLRRAIRAALRCDPEVAA